MHPEKRERLRADLGAPATSGSSSSRSSSTTSTPLVAMGPNAHHHERHGPQRVTVSVTVADVQGLSVPSTLPEPQVSGSLKPSPSGSVGSSDELVVTR